MARNSKGWALAVEGQSIDLDDLRELLPAPCDTWVEEYNDGERDRLLLRSSGWVAINDSDEATEYAKGLLDRVNAGLRMLRSDTVPLSFGGIFRFGDDGNRLAVTLNLSVNCSVTSRSRARMSLVSTLAGNVVEQAASPLQLWLKRASTDVVTSDLLAFLARADNWFDLYKAMECVEKLVGGSKRAISNHSDWERVRQTANYHRHAPAPQRPLPKRPVTLVEAQAILFPVASQVLNDLCA